MFFWFLFYIVELFIVALAQKVTDLKNKKILYSFSALIAIYFSAFRDCLGTDYKGYITQFGVQTFDSNSEPLFNVIKYIILNTNFSPVLFFASCAIVTLWFIWKYLDNGNNEFASISIIIFLSIPGLYFNTFNIVRQYFSVALFLYSLKYIQSRQLIRYIICITVACMMHLSSIILFPLYFILNKKYSIKTYIILAAILFFIAYSIEPIINTLTVLSDKYSVYLEADEESGNSTITFLCIIILIMYFIISKRSKLKQYNTESSYEVITINLFILYTIFSVIVFVNFYFYRLSFFFGISLCVMFPYVLNQIFRNKSVVNIVCLFFSFLYFFSFIIMGMDNSEICPDKLLSITSLFDISPI